MPKLDAVEFMEEWVGWLASDECCKCEMVRGKKLSENLSEASRVKNMKLE